MPIELEEASGEGTMKGHSFANMCDESSIWIGTVRNRVEQSGYNIIVEQQEVNLLLRGGLTFVRKANHIFNRKKI